MSAAYDCPPVGGYWRSVDPARDLAERPGNTAKRATGGTEMTTMTGERAELEKSTGLPLTSLSEQEWDKVREAATRFAAKKLHITYNEAARHYPEFIREGYMAAIKGRKGARGIPREPREQRPTSLAEAADLGLQDYESRMIRRTEEYAEKHDLSFNEAARYIV